MGVHSEPYPVNEEYAFQNHIWDRQVGRLTVRYAVGLDAQQINETSVRLDTVDKALMDELTDVLSRIVEDTHTKLDAPGMPHQNVNFIDNAVGA